MEKVVRKRRDASQMNALMSLWERSELSVKAFCQLHKVPVSIFSYWRHRQKRKVQGEIREMGFSKVCLPVTGSTGGIFARIRFANGVELELEQRVESSWIKALLQ